MTIAKTDLRIEMNERSGGRDESQTTCDRFIKQALKIMSIEAAWECLQDTDSTQTLAAGASELTMPTNCAAIDSIFLGDSIVPLEKMMSRRPPAALLETMEPSEYEIYKGVIRLNALADTAYAATINYGKYHALSADTILFGDEFFEALAAKVTQLFALSKGTTLIELANVQGQLYQEQIYKLKGVAREEPRCMRYNRY